MKCSFCNQCINPEDTMVRASLMHYHIKCYVDKQRELYEGEEPYFPEQVH